MLLELDHARVFETTQHRGLAPGGVLDGLAQGGVGVALAEADADPSGLGEIAAAGEVVRPG